MKKTILLTGGTGFIGRNIRESSMGERYNIVAPGHRDLDVADTASVDKFFNGRYFDAVLHTAVKPGHRAAADLTNLFYTNVRMFQNMERNRDHFGKFINFGSGAIYDVSQNNSNVSESQIYQNMGTDDHSFTKYVVHKQIDNLPNFYDLNIFGIFGKYEDYSIRFISNAICKSLFNMPITLRQNRRFSYLYVNDLPPILEWFIENTPRYKSYNITPDGFTELRDIANIVSEISGDMDVRVAQPGYGLDYWGNNSRIRTEMPEIKFTSIHDAISELYQWYKQNINLIDKQKLSKDR
ncbi:MAG: NAD(P)-dependent oxidoreductase [Alphaproteobacteria bacterium]|nr:NAD(P)-dependent oxidoreductase [Alphaproteobacteria bacterium]